MTSNVSLGHKITFTAMFMLQKPKQFEFIFYIEKEPLGRFGII